MNIAASRLDFGIGIPFVVPLIGRVMQGPLWTLALSSKVVTRGTLRYLRFLSVRIFSPQKGTMRKHSFYVLLCLFVASPTPLPLRFSGFGLSSYFRVATVFRTDRQFKNNLEETHKSLMRKPLLFLPG